MRRRKSGSASERKPGLRIFSDTERTVGSLGDRSGRYREERSIFCSLPLVWRKREKSDLYCISAIVGVLWKKCTCSGDHGKDRASGTFCPLPENTK